VTHEDDIAAHAKRIIRLRDGLLQSDRTNDRRRRARAPAHADEQPVRAEVA
jgi:ABC-type lipoprotein export system ATPase subunit